MKAWVGKKNQGFTIVELLIVIAVVAILAAIVVVAFNGIRNRAEQTSVSSTHAQVLKRIELEKAKNGGSYPASVTDCSVPTDSNICLDDSRVTYRYTALSSAAAAGYAGTLATPAYELSVEGDARFLYKSTAEIRGVNEFMQYTDMAPLIDKYGLKKYKISFDIKADVAGPVNVYMQNGSGSKYTFGIDVPVTTAFTRQSVQLTPTQNANSETKSILAFYGIYGTGKIVTVKNVEIQLAQ